MSEPKQNETLSNMMMIFYKSDSKRPLKFESGIQTNYSRLYDGGYADSTCSSNTSHMSPRLLLLKSKLFGNKVKIFFIFLKQLLYCLFSLS